MARHILHADLDAFFASVEQLDDPALKGRPVVVGGSPEGRGVVAAASYEVRQFGVHSAMPMRTALLRCPQATRVSPRFDRYQEVSSRVMGLFREITPHVEPLSLDEAYLDVTEAVSDRRSPRQVGEALRIRVRIETGLTISVGVATSKSVAKIASGMNKPDSLTEVHPGEERAFLAPLPVEKLWGIGPKTSARLAAEGVHTIGELAKRPQEWWAATFGNVWPHLRALAQGQDDSPVQTRRERKSVSAETTLARDTGDPQVLSELIARLSQRVASQLADKGVGGRTVKLKLRLADFTTFTRQTTLSEPVDSAEAIGRAAGGMLQRELDDARLFRLVGVGVSGLDNRQVELLQPRLEGFE